MIPRKLSAYIWKSRVPNSIRHETQGYSRREHRAAHRRIYVFCLMPVESHGRVRDHRTPNPIFNVNSSDSHVYPDPTHQTRAQQIATPSINTHTANGVGDCLFVKMDGKVIR